MNRQRGDRSTECEESPLRAKHSCRALAVYSKNQESKS